jgi:APA family basic amino acid/polyamine antiporter
MMSFREACGALGKRATRLKSADAALAASDASMKKCLTAADLLLLGVGGVIGGGVFVLTGAAAHDHAGPAVVISYVLASLTSMITGLCYTEFAVETPVAGSAYNFVSMAFGEFAGYLCGCNLALELTIAAAAVARGWTSYVATLFHASPDALRIRIGRGAHDDERGSSSSFVELDFAAAALVALVTALLAYGMKETARFNTSVTAISLLVIFFVITFGGARVEKENWTPFAPGGVEGVLAGASVVFFSFVGFDTVATCCTP